jgi:glycerophosphoryl diester phosphodiesterase
VPPLRPALLAHRGGALEAPENTLAAIFHARRAGADGVELDVRLSGDGRAVLFHDADLFRLGGTLRRVDQSGFHELSGIALGNGRPPFAGERIPTLEQALDAARGLAPIQLELKSEGDGERLARRALDAMRRAGLAREVELTSFDPAAVAAVRAADPEIPAGLVLDRPPGDSAWLRYPLVSLSTGLARSGWAERARSAGLRVYVWTENDPATIPFWAGLGIDGLITDRPSLFRRSG